MHPPPAPIVEGQQRAQAVGRVQQRDDRRGRRSRRPAVEQRGQQRRTSLTRPAAVRQRPGIGVGESLGLQPNTPYLAGLLEVAGSAGPRCAWPASSPPSPAVAAAAAAAGMPARRRDPSRRAPTARSADRARPRLLRSWAGSGTRGRDPAALRPPAHAHADGVPVRAGRMHCRAGAEGGPRRSAP